MMTAGGIFVFTLVFVFLLSEGEVGVEEVVMMKAVHHLSPPPAVRATPATYGCIAS